MTLGQNVPKLDALHLMDGIEGLRSLPKHSVDMLLTDPPYGTTRNFWDVPLPLPELWEAVRWAVKPNGAILFFAQCPFDKVLGASNLAMLRYEWVSLLTVLYLAIQMIVKAKNKYMAFILPPIIMYVLDYLTQTAAQTYSVTMALQPMVARATSFVITIEGIAIIFGALLAIDIVCLFIGNRRNRDVI